MKEENLKDNLFTKKITRKEAVKKVGITALTASTMVFLSTKAYAGGSGVTAGNNLSPARTPTRGR